MGNVQGSPVYLGGYELRETGAILFWDGAPGGTLLRIKSSYYGSLENLTFVGATPQKYLFNTSTSGDPGATFISFKSATFANVTEIYANIDNFYNVEIPDWLDGLDQGTRGRLTIQRVNSSSFAIFDVTGSVTGSGSWRTIPVSPVQASSASNVFGINEELIVSFVSLSGTPQAYAFSDSTATNPASGTLRFDNLTFASITKIYASVFRAGGTNVVDWLNSIDDGPDVRVTVMHSTDSTILRIFKVTSVSTSGSSATINVEPIHGAGSISNGDPIVLICSTPTQTRDRAGALVVQQSETGFASGHALIQNCTFQDADDGVRLDEQTPSNNCADNTFVQCSFLNCGAGIKSNSIQVVNNTVINCDFTGCTVGIDHALGGDMRVFGSSMNGYAGDVFFKVRQGGGNASSFVLYGLRLEMSAGKPSLLETIDTNEFDTINVLIDGFGWTGVYPAEWDDMTDYFIGDEVRIGSTVYRSLSGTPADPPTPADPNTGNSPESSPSDWLWIGDWVRPIRLSQNTNCTIRGSIVKGPFAEVTGDTARATLRLDNCRLSYNQTDVVTTGTNGVYKTLDCTDGSGVPVEDTGNWPRFRIMPISRSFGTTSVSAAFRLPPMPAFSARVTAARLVVGAGVTASNDDYWSFRLRNKGVDGTEDTDVLATSNVNTTRSSGGINAGGGLDENGVGDLTLHGTESNRVVSPGQVLVFEASMTDSPGPLVDGVVEIDVEPAA